MSSTHFKVKQVTLTHPLPPHVIPAMLFADFWLAEPEKRLMTVQDSVIFNRRVYEILNLPEIFTLPDELPAEQVRAQIEAYFSHAGKTRYGGNTLPLPPDYFVRLHDNALPELDAFIPVQFGLALRRTSVRAFPSSDLIMAEPYDFAFDLAQETSIDVGWPVAVLVSSRDNKWIFCLAPHYWGWIAAADVAIGTRQQVQEYAEAASFVRTLASRGLVALEKGGGVTPQMGTKLPLIDEQPEVMQVSVPVRGEDGHLKFTCGYMRKTTGEFHQGDLPCTLFHLFTQAFSLTGEGYAWGDSRLGIFGRDCSRFIKDVYATTGVILPRNGDQQGKVGHLRVEFPKGMSDEERLALIVEQGQPGDILVIPTHVMLYLGHVEGKPYIIHDVTQGQNRIIVSDLMMGQNTPRGTLVSRLDRMVGL
ncbi:MAG: SH3 domain-containing protein [Anaerolineae bacterium]|nr:SH3 domain-containing protein [Anaerolineae bacterium]